jgi:peptidoglycan/LPS O-acetylase OafA/YrhL
MLFIVVSLIFAFSLIFALRRFSKLNIKTRAKFASLLGFVGIASIVYTMTDFITWIKAIVYSLPLTCLIAMLVWRNKDKINKMPKGAVQLGIVCSFFFWRWLHTVSLELEATLGFTVCFTMIFMAFSLDEKYFKFESR